MQTFVITPRVTIQQFTPRRWNVIVDGQIVFRALGQASARRNAQLHIDRHIDFTCSICGKRLRTYDLQAGICSGPC